MTTIAAARALTPAGWTGPCEVVVESSMIGSIRPTSTVVNDRTLLPGFIDLQANGHEDTDVATATPTGWDRLDDLLVRQGVTTWCPTLVTAPLGAYAAPLGRIADAAARSGPRPAIAGAHLEGPFLGGRPGAHPPQLIREVDPGWIEDLDPIVQVLTLAPEAGDTAPAIAALARRGVLVGLGHSAATYEQAGAAVDAGATLVTHCFNAMAALHHRAPGLVGAALTDDRLTVSLIADLAHTHPALVRLAFRAKGAERVALVTDAVAWRSGHLGEIDLAAPDGLPRLPDGTIAGSTLTMVRAVRNAVGSCGVPLADAAAAAATTPARLLGLADRGCIEVGRRADLVALGPDLGLTGTWIGGHRVFRPPR